MIYLGWPEAITLTVTAIVAIAAAVYAGDRAQESAPDPIAEEQDRFLAESRAAHARNMQAIRELSEEIAQSMPSAAQSIDFSADDWGGHSGKPDGLEFIINGQHFTLYSASGFGKAHDGRELFSLTFKRKPRKP